MIALPTFRGALAGFNPLSLSPALWLSDTGSDPSVWTDISGNGRNAVQATGANQPSIVTGVLNGRQVRRFNGTSSFLSSAWTSIAMPNTSTFVVFKWDGGGGGSEGRRFLLESTSVSADVFRPSLAILAGASPQKVRSTFGETADSVFADSANTISSSPTIVSSIGSNGTSIFINGSAGQSVAGGLGIKNITGINIGTYRSNDNRWYSGDIAEILVFPTALSATNRQRVERYLAGKYAITI